LPTISARAIQVVRVVQKARATVPSVLASKRSTHRPASSSLATDTQPDERRLDPRDNPARFANQRLALPARPLGILLSKRRHRDHLAMSVLTAQPAEKGALEKLRVESATAEVVSGGTLFVGGGQIAPALCMAHRITAIG